MSPSAIIRPYYVFVSVVFMGVISSCDLDSSKQIGGPELPAPIALTNEEICIAEHQEALGIVAGDAVSLLQDISKSIGSLSIPKVISCAEAEKAHAYYKAGVGSGTGEYILYNPNWLREVTGNDPDQLLAIFAHELGHFVNRDFTAPRNGLSREVRERGADKFAGCVFYKLERPFSSIEDLFSRLRRERDYLYPDRLSSLEAAKEGYDECAGRSDENRTPRERVAITIVGPMTGPYSDFGYSHSRGVTAALSHFLDRACGVDPLDINKYFDIRIEDEWQLFKI